MQKSKVIDWLSLVIAVAIGSDLIYTHVRLRNIEKITPGGNLAAAEETMPTGTKFLPMPAKSLLGHRVRIAAGRQKLIFYISTSCGVCAKQMPEWSEAARTLGKESVLFLTAENPPVATREVPKYLASYGVEGFPTASIDKQVMMNYSMFSVPRILLVSNDGRVRQVWGGRVARETLLQAWNSHLKSDHL